MILVDTSVWIDWFRNGPALPWHGLLSEALLARQVAIVPLVISELLVGARSERERTAVHVMADSAAIWGIDLESWIRAGELGRLWRERGRTLSITDCLLAAEAHERGARLWTLDRDFEPLFAAHFIEPVAPPVGPGQS